MTFTGAVESGQPPNARKRRPDLRSGLLAAVLVLVAALLRAFDVDGMSLWSDEGLSFYRATKSVPFILSGRIDVGLMPTRDVQPPLYFLALAAWFDGVGTSPWAAKWFSVLWSLPTVAAVWALGRRLLGSWGAFVAAGFAALSSVYLWYAQEVRPYTMLVTLGALAVYALIRAAGIGTGAPAAARRQAPSLRWLLAAFCCAVAAGWTHYLGFFLLPLFASTIALAISRFRHARRLWLAAFAAGVALLPLVPFAVARIGLGAERDQHFVPLRVMALDVVRGFTFGLTADLERLTWTVPLLVVVASLGFWSVWRRDRRGAVILVGYLTIPTLGLFALTFLKPVYMGVRHILIVSPAWYLLLAAGLTAVPARRGRTESAPRTGRAGGGWPVQVVRVGMISAVAAGMLMSDWAHYFDSTWAKDDLRAMAAYVGDRDVPGDALGLSDPVLEHVLAVYLPEMPITAAPMPGDPRPLEEQVEALDERHPRLWYMTPGDQELSWLEGRRVLSDRQAFAGKSIPVRIDAWDLPPLADEMTPVPPPPETEAVVITGWRSTPARAGEAMRLSLDLEAGPDVPAELTTSVRLVDEAGLEVASWDQPLARSTSDTPRRFATVDVPLAPGMPPGEHTVMVSLYAPESDASRMAGVTWPAAGPLPLGSILVSPTRPGVKAMPSVRLHARSGGWRLEGYDAPDLWTAGEVSHARIWLTREAASDPESRHASQLRLSLRSAEADDVQADVPLPDDVVVGETRWVPVSLRAPDVAPDSGGAMELEVAILDDAGTPLPLAIGGRNTVEALALGAAAVRAVPIAQDVPDTAVRAAWEFDGIGTLTGYEIRPTATGEMEVVLYWRASGPTERRTHVSLQLLPPAGAADHRPVAQHDGEPAGGSRPTTGWRPDEVIADAHILSLPPSLSSGEYTLAAALYDLNAGGQRFSVKGPSGTLEADALARLQTLTYPWGP